ncbi:ABC transporter ATP-binding protein [Hansschlegelia beijingensis]|uniref:ABC transporter ATP-binding protein n=1 Tax=Hansschlegelia beijingensis TaxID=1133344 RepID=UPI00387F1956
MVTTVPQSEIDVPANAAGKSRVELKNVSRGFGEEWDREEVIKNLTFEIKPGDLTCIVGPSGCGKSTIVNLVAGYDTPESGEILLNGSPVRGPGKDRMVVFQETALMPWQTTYDNVVFGPLLRGEGSRAEIDKEARRLLDRVGLGDFKKKYPSQLSGGMQRRAELARALINKPVLLIMDEPFRGLDAMSRPLMQEFFLRLFEENRRTNLFVTSEIEEAIFLADRLIVLSNRPAQVRAVIEIPLPRPRQFHMMSSPEVFEIKRQALEILHEEAMKSFRGQGVRGEQARPQAQP